MIRCEARMIGEDKQKVDMTLGGNTRDITYELVAICGTVIQELEPQLKVPIDEFVKNISDMLLVALEERKDTENDQT